MPNILVYFGIIEEVAKSSHKGEVVNTQVVALVA